MVLKLAANLILKVCGLRAGVRWPLTGQGRGMLNWLGKVRLGKVL
jgi:hypothetical protein